MNELSNKVVELFNSGNYSRNDKFMAMYDVIRAMTQTTGAVSVIAYDDMLLPDNESKFRREIPRYVWEELKQRAQLLHDAGQYQTQYERDHLRSIINNQPPFGYKVAPNPLFEQWVADNPEEAIVDAFVKFKELHPELNPKVAKKAFGERIVRIFVK